MEELLVQLLTLGTHILGIKLALNKNALDVTKVHDESIRIQFALHGNLQMQ